MNHNLNIFILSAGRRVELIQCFRKAAIRLGIDSKIVVGDCSETAPAIYFSDKAYKLPRISEQNYINEIVDICNKENIALIIPTIDTELLLLSENKKIIESSTNAKVAVSEVDVVKICRDKLNTQIFMEENHFGVPKMYSDVEIEAQEIQFPVFIKPRNGSSSINTFKVNDIEELKLYNSFISDPIVQEFIEGDEYTVDVFLDFDSKIITVVPRLRIATRSGEISKGKIVKDQEIIDNVTKLLSILKPVGHITVQLMKTANGIKYIEINPRFGGGAPMSIKAGADSCENYYRLLQGQVLEYHENYKENITFLRFDSSVCIDENLNLLSLE